MNKTYIYPPPITEDNMELYLAGEHPVKNGTKQVSWEDINILESFYYVKNNRHFDRLYPHVGNFLLDSGAFTFLSKGHENVNWDKYVDEYAAFINKYNVKHFFELDIDSIVGYSEVLRLRAKLEALTNKQCIPVWHISRGKDEFVNMCKKYKYVALGGIVSKDIPTNIYEKMFPWFISNAHKYGAKIHGLGYTRIEGLKKYHFDSVDSTAWLHGNIGGYIYKFDPVSVSMIQHRTKQGQRQKSTEAAQFNFREWVKFQKYARVNL